MAAPLPRKAAKVTVRAIVGENTDKKDARAKLRALYKRVKSQAIIKDNAEAERKNVQQEAVALSGEHGLDNDPIRFSINGKMYQGTVIRPHASPVWDVEAVVDYLHRTGRWDSCSTQSFDQTKFEAEVAQGNIPRTQVKKFLREKEPSSPYCRIVEV